MNCFSKLLNLKNIIYIVSFIFLLVSNSNLNAAVIIDGFTDCLKADDGRPVCREVSTGKLKFVSNDFFITYESFQNNNNFNKNTNSNSLNKNQNSTGVIFVLVIIVLILFWFYYWFTQTLNCPKCGHSNWKSNAKSEEVIERNHKYRSKKMYVTRFNGNTTEKHYSHTEQEPYYERTVEYNMVCSKCSHQWYPRIKENEN